MFSRLLASVGLAALEGELTAIARRARRRAILTAVAMLLWVVAFAFALAALTVFLAGLLGPLAACGIVGGVFAIVALILQIIASAQARRPPPPPSLAALEATLGKEAGDGTTFGLMAIVAVAGYMLARHLFRR
jgi:hypothetical protein